MAAGLPMWGRLLSDLATDAKLTDDEKKELDGLNFLDQARVIEKRMGGTSTMTKSIASRLEGRFYGLTHSFLQALPSKGTQYTIHTHHTIHACSIQINEANMHTQMTAYNIETITMNYDTLYEAAVNAAGKKIAVLPYMTGGVTTMDGNPWLLKMHGCVTHPEDIVLTR